MTAMTQSTLAFHLLAQEARALLTRLDRVKSFALYETMVPAAAVSVDAQTAIERYMAHGRLVLRGWVMDYLRWLSEARSNSATPEDGQRRFTLLRLRFNTMLSQFDIFADVMTQRSEHESGVWLAGLDAVADDALKLPGNYYAAPPLMCYLDRGHGAAIRRARTRLPGGGDNPVAIVRVPRERMVSSGIASSLVHEVGHQGAALLDLVNSLRPVLRGLQRTRGRERLAWILWERWTSEIVSDLWSVGKVGVASTLGLMGVVSLPRAFVFRSSLDDPHPIPWIRVRLSCAMGDALYPHPQWRVLSRVWASYYPLEGLDDAKRELMQTVDEAISSFVEVLIHHRPRSLRGRSLGEVIASDDRSPARLNVQFDVWRRTPGEMLRTPPALAFAIVGQARADGRLSPEAESRMLATLLTHWALHRALDASATCASHTQKQGVALAA